MSLPVPAMMDHQSSIRGGLFDCTLLEQDAESQLSTENSDRKFTAVNHRNSVKKEFYQQSVLLTDKPLDFSIVKQEANDQSSIPHEESASKVSIKFQLASNLANTLAKNCEDKQYNCLLCNELFEDISAFELHMKNHSYSLKYEYQNHVGIFNSFDVPSNPGGKPFQCSVCFKAFSSARDTEIHMRTHTGERPFKCDKCGQLFVSSRGLRQHGKLHAGVKPYECSVCKKTFYGKTDLNTHMRKHTGERPFHCTICDQSFSFKSNLYKHIRRLHAVSSKNSSKEMVNGSGLADNFHRCSLCNKPFWETAKFNKHLKTHTGEKPYSCDFCDQKFGTSGNLIRHKRRVHHGCKSFKCAICSKTFREQYDLTVHVRTHTGEKPYKCTVCDGAFATSSARKRHISRVHDVERSYKCSVCFKGFNAKGDIDCHMRTHTGEKPYHCPFCNRAFTTNSMLHRHIRSIHTGEKAYQCSVCFKKFHSGYDVTAHMMVHTGEMPFACFQCGKEFRTRYSLKKHQVTCSSTQDSGNDEDVKPDKDPLKDKEENCNSYNTDENKNYEGDNQSACLRGKSFQPAKPEIEKEEKSGNEENPYKCSFCGQVFTVKASLKMHMKIHRGGFEFNCMVCTQSFIKSSFLRAHMMKTHKGKKLFECRLCKKPFMYKRLLAVHMRSHTGKKPYSCFHCEISFSLMSSHQKHMRISHKQEGQVESLNSCKKGVNLDERENDNSVHCEVKTKSCQALKLVNSVEKGEQFQDLYECGVCMQIFHSNSEMSAHMKTHTLEKLEKEKSFLCFICEKAFCSRSNVYRHVRRLHKGIVPQDACVAI